VEKAVEKNNASGLWSSKKRKKGMSNVLKYWIWRQKYARWRTSYFRASKKELKKLITKTY